MSRRFVGLLLGAALVLIAVAWALWRAPLRRPPAAPVSSAAEANEPTPTATPDWQIELLFPAERGGLAREARSVAAAELASHRVAQVVEALLAGPASDGLVPLFSFPVTVGGVMLTRDGIAYVDLHAADQPSPPSSGSELERLRVFAVVDSVLQNVPEVDRVVLLWNGSQRPSFAGHLDTGRPLAADRDLASGAR